MLTCSATGEANNAEILRFRWLTMGGKNTSTHQKHVALTGSKTLNRLHQTELTTGVWRLLFPRA